MYKLSIRIILFASAVVALSSCGKQASFSLTKRHYRSGYYVDFLAKSRSGSSPSIILPKGGINKATTVTAAKTENVQIASGLSVFPEKGIAVQKNKTGRKIEISENENVNYNTPEQVVFKTKSSIANDISESVTATTGEVRVYVVNVPFVVILICAIFIPPLGVGLMYGPNVYFWVDLLLTLLFFIPGLIFALIVVLM